MKRGAVTPTRVWHKQHERVLCGWGEGAACYRYMHYKAHCRYKQMNMRMTLPIIIISTVTGTANFAQETFPISMRHYVPAMIGTLNLFAAILTTISQFLKVGELMESHRVSAVHYGKLARTIRLELSLPITERSYDGGDMVETSKGEYDRLIEQSPPVPTPILKMFERRFPEDSNTDKSDQFMRPEIMTIRAIELYDNANERHLTETVVSAFKARVTNTASSLAATTVDAWNRDEEHEELILELKGLQSVRDTTVAGGLVEVVVDDSDKDTDQ
jgi:hypothetical protein